MGFFRDGSATSFPCVDSTNMKQKTINSPISLLFGAIILLCWAAKAPAVVLHPNEGEPNLATWTDRPDPNVLGQWQGTLYASCVAISSNCVITTRHQGGGIDTPVCIGGKTYLVDQIINNSADLRIVRLYGANLTSFVQPYPTQDETGKDFVIGGFGQGRGADIPNKGYYWAGAASMAERWGQNRVNGTNSLDGTSLITADFDPLTAGDSNGARPYEAILTGGDSGGGWFIYDSTQNKWQVAGLSRGTWDHSAQSWYTPPDYFDAIQMSVYADWVLQNLPEPLPGDFTGDDWTDFADFAVLAKYWLTIDCNEPDHCAGVDYEPDGDVDFDDLEYWYNCWLTGTE